MGGLAKGFYVRLDERANRIMEDGELRIHGFFGLDFLNGHGVLCGQGRDELHLRGGLDSGNHGAEDLERRQTAENDAAQIL